MNQINCDFCNSLQEELYIFTLPCGFSVCFDQINTQDLVFKCFICLDHMIDKQHCFDMRKNKLKLEKIEFLNKKKQILKKFDKIDDLKINYESKLNDHFMKIINEIDLKREILKKSFNEKVDEYCFSLISYVEKLNLDTINCLKNKIDEIDTKTMRDRLLPMDHEQIQNDLFSEFRLNLINSIFENIKEVEEIKFNQSEIKNPFKLSEIFGTVGSNNIKVSHEDKDKSSNSKNVPFTFGLKTFEELSTGEIISSLHSKPSSLLKIDLNNSENFQIFEDPSNSKINYIFKKEEDELITIHENFSIKIFRNKKFSPCFLLPPKKIIFIDIFKTKLIMIDQDYFLSRREYKNGKTEVKYEIQNKQMFSMRAMTDNLVLFGHDNKIVLLDLSEKSVSNLHNTSSRVLIIERINQNEFIIGCKDGIISILCTIFKSKKISKKCHDGPIQCIQVCHDSNVLSFGMKDKKIGLRMAKNLDLIFEISALDFVFCRRSISGKLVGLDSNGKVYAKDDNKVRIQ